MQLLNTPAQRGHVVGVLRSRTGYTFLHAMNEICECLFGSANGRGMDVLAIGVSVVLSWSDRNFDAAM